MNAYAMKPVACETSFMCVHCRSRWPEIQVSKSVPLRCSESTITCSRARSNVELGWLKNQELC